MSVGADGGGKVTMLWRASTRELSLGGVAVALLLISACSAPPQAPAPSLPSSVAISTATVTSAAAPGPSNSTPSNSGPSNSAPSTPGPSASTVGASGDEPERGSGANNGSSLAWVPPGPVDPTDPPQAQWYVLLQNKDCAGLDMAVSPRKASSADGFALWSAVSSICRAVEQGDASGWRDAATRLSALIQPGPERCLDRTAYNLVASFLAAHAQNPTESPPPWNGSSTACPLGLAGLDALDGQGPTGRPSSGLAGGRFQLAGRFVDVVTVMVGGQPVGVEADPARPGRWMVVIPPAAVAGQVQVTAAGSGGPIPGSLTFTYLRDPEATTAPEPPRGSSTTTPNIASSTPQTSKGSG
ncbi:hypothetical protein [Arthrobacter psychrochitiniphilus]|uniref:hypothetical protein n=1 Tax=Arthrobacter psychrochitiniphilus TaxID=291045 RepID=UPI0011B61D43|nr:hypothetical protein [Arthrobacter psychrochitiniphilus]NYG17591.1 hypothetical protein [Arthrobacter psychrochitiniphilus]